MTLKGKINSRLALLNNCRNLLNRADQRKIVVVAIVQILLSVLDLVGVAIIGVIGALTVNGIQSKPAGNRVTSVLRDLFLSLELY